MQLVKNQRAIWVTHDTIQIVEIYEEVNNLDKVENEETSYNNNENTVFEDQVVLDIAKRRLAMKKNLRGQVLDFCAIIFWFFMLANVHHFGDRFILAFIFCMFWGIRLTVRILRFLKPTLKNGIFEYFKERKRQQLEDEYNRIKKKGADYIVVD